MDIQLWLNVSGMQQLLLFQNLTVEYIKVIKISFFLTSTLHRQMQSLSRGYHLVSFKAKHSLFLQLALRRHGCGFQTFSHLCSFMSVDTPLFVWDCLGAWDLPVPGTQHSTLLWSKQCREQGPSHP